VKGFQHKKSRFISVNVNTWPFVVFLEIWLMVQKHGYMKCICFHYIRLLFDTLDYSHRREYTRTKCEH